MSEIGKRSDVELLEHLKNLTNKDNVANKLILEIYLQPKLGWSSVGCRGGRWGIEEREWRWGEEG